MHIVFLGAPGCGKGTQAGIIAQSLGIAHIASGDLFREAVRRGNQLGEQVRSYMEKGLLVPDKITISMILESISGTDRAKGYVLDGFPRTVGQAESLDRALEALGEAIEKVVYIKVSGDELTKRLSARFVCRHCQAPYHEITSRPKVPGKCDRCGGELYQRPDDSPETVRKRLEVYFAETAPLIDYYRRAGKLVEVNGGQGIDQVAQELMAALE
ncbi:adenylate kinase [Chloroflexota bacterium]